MAFQDYRINSCFVFLFFQVDSPYELILQLVRDRTNRILLLARNRMNSHGLVPRPHQLC